jgi:hypothetical protein
MEVKHYTCKSLVWLTHKNWFPANNKFYTLLVYS